MVLVNAIQVQDFSKLTNLVPSYCEKGENE